MSRIIYLDNAATTKPYREVVEYMSKVAFENFGNPSSLHNLGMHAEKLIEKARGIIAKGIGADTNEIIFTSGGTESNNMAIRGFAYANRKRGKHIITTKIEHPAVLETVKSLQEEGFDVDYLNVNKEGIVELEELSSKMRSDTILISIILVNNEVGSLQPLQDIINIKNEKNGDIALHIDAVQAFGKLNIDVSKYEVDLISLSAHKIHGPKGAGALYIRRGTHLKPILFGGGQEWKYRSGTENVPAICGFGLAAEIVLNEIDKNMNKVSKLKDVFINHLRENIEGKYLLNSGNKCIPHIVNVSFKGIKSEVLLHHLENKGIYVSTGSACSSRKNIRSHVLKAMRIPPQLIDGAVRFSFSSENTEQNIIETVGEIKDIIKIIRF